MTHELWTTLNAKMYEYLASVTLANLVDIQLKKLGGDVSLLKDARRASSSPRFKVMSATA